MTEFELWTYRGVIVALLAVVWYFGRDALKQLKEMNASLRIMSEKLIGHDGKIEIVNERIGSHEKRLNDHASRLRDVERKQDACTSCPE